jgi:hypothetical protein
MYQRWRNDDATNPHHANQDPGGNSKNEEKGGVFQRMNTTGCGELDRGTSGPKEVVG